MFGCDRLLGLAATGFCVWLLATNSLVQICVTPVTDATLLLVKIRPWLHLQKTVQSRSFVSIVFIQTGWAELFFEPDMKQIAATCKRMSLCMVTSEKIACMVTWAMIVCCDAGSRDREQFYSDLYSVTPDPQKALHALLDGKEAFSQQLCQGLMSRLLGVLCTFPAASAQ